MRLGFAVAVWLALTSLATAKDTFSMYGVGNESCASWLASPSKEFEGTNWVVGFWSGANYAMSLAGTGGEVGDSTDGNGIVGEIKKRCSSRPSEKLSAMTITVFHEFLDAKK